jgi:hypothetical protein
VGLHEMQQVRCVPTTEFKIDRLFVQDAVTDERARIITGGCQCGYILKPFTRRTFEAKVTEVMARLPGPLV